MGREIKYRIINLMNKSFYLSDVLLFNLPSFSTKLPAILDAVKAYTLTRHANICAFFLKLFQMRGVGGLGQNLEIT